MSDDILKEVLGFDPTTGDTVEYKGNLQQVPIQENDKHGNLLVDIDVQDEFENYVHATYSNPEAPFILAKKSLFLAIKSGDRVTRTFFSHNPAENDRIKKFREQSQATFLKQGTGKYVPDKLAFFGEGENDERITIDFHARPDTDTVTLDAQMQNRSLIAWFDESTQLAELTFSYSSGNHVSALFHITKNTTYKAAVEGKVKQTIDSDTYEITHDRKNDGPIDITRKKNGEDLDHLVVPWHLTNEKDYGRRIRLAEVASWFFGEYDIADPFTQPVNSVIDDFARTNPIETLGITWTRGSEENSTPQ